MRRLKIVLLLACVSVSGKSSSLLAEDSPTAPMTTTAIVGPGTRTLLPAGKEVDAIDGDIILKNDFLTAVIAKPVAGRDANLTTKNVGGFLLDLTTTDGGSDQLTYLNPGGGGVEFRSLEFPNWNFGTDDEGHRFEPAPGNRLDSPNGASLTVISADGEVKASYFLPADAAYLVISIEKQNGESSIDFRIDGGNDRIGVADEGVSEWFWAEDAYWGQAYGVRAVNQLWFWHDDLKEAVQPTMQVKRSGRISSLQLAPVESAKADEGLRSSFLITAAPHRLDVRRTLFPQEPNGTLNLSYPLPEALASEPLDRLVEASVDVVISQRTGPRLEQIGKMRMRAGETASVPVPTGPIEVASSRFGYEPVRSRLHFKANDVVSLNEWLFESDGVTPPTRRLSLVIDDEQGWPIPAKIEIRRQRGIRPQIHFGPDTAERRVKNLMYVVDGFEELLLPQETYQLSATHGPEYHRATTIVDLADSSQRETSFVIQRAFETPGWISTDYHSHSSPSGDNISSQRGRVLNLVCEDIDFAPCTEHNRVSSYQSHIEELGIEGHILSCSGIELTGSPLPLNHHNVFPMRHTPFAQNGGGPYTADNPDEQIERLYLWDDRSTKVIQQDHPDIGWLFRDRNGDGELDEGFARGVDLLDCIEVHPIESVLELFPDADEAKGEAAQSWNRGRFVGWLQLLNQGRRLPGVVNTDAHYNFHGSGWLRNWIQVPNDEPSQCKLSDIIAGTKAGRIIMSNGPMLELTLTSNDDELAELGEEVRVKDGQVTANVRVRCADWVHCDRVAILVDGRPAVVFDTEQTPDAFHDDVVVFEESVPLSIDHDAPVLAICGSKTKTLGAVYGIDHATRNFAAATNPIWVNVGEESWDPSNDTLDVPLRGKMP